jgi:hypothetical protein
VVSVSFRILDLEIISVKLIPTYRMMRFTTIIDKDYLMMTDENMEASVKFLRNNPAGTPLITLYFIRKKVSYNF